MFLQEFAKLDRCTDYVIVWMNTDAITKEYGGFGLCFSFEWTNLCEWTNCVYDNDII